MMLALPWTPVSPALDRVQTRSDCYADILRFRPFAFVPKCRAVGGLRVDLAGEGVIRRVDVHTAEDGQPVAGNRCGQLVAHDRGLVEGSADQRLLIQWGEYLSINRRLVPALRRKEKDVCLLGIDPRDQRLPHVFVGKAKGMPRFVADDSLVLRID